MITQRQLDTRDDLLTLLLVARACGGVLSDITVAERKQAIKDADKEVFDDEIIRLVFDEDMQV